MFSPKSPLPNALSDRLEHLQLQISQLLLYRSVGETEIGQAFQQVLAAMLVGDRRLALWSYANWFRLLAASGQSWQAYLIQQILQANNPFTQAAQRSRLTAALRQAAEADLRSLQILYNCQTTDICDWLQTQFDLPTAPIAWTVEEASEWVDSGVWSAGQFALATKLRQLADWAAGLDAIAAYHRRWGVGEFARFRAFRWVAGQLVGVAHPDPIDPLLLVGYDSQKQTLLQNTEALLAGQPALHVLLYGSRGSGKSSLIKSLLSAYGDRGLRLVEVGKAELRDLPEIVDRLRSEPQKFVIFVDDLSFEEDDDTYKSLKVVLEGSITARPRNLVVYATSNRRHLIREFHADRPRPSDADEIHAWDTLQEKLSFSDRFGLTLTFEPANQQTYLAIVRHLSQQAQLAIDPAELEAQALQWATRHNGRSGRTAQQFIDFLQTQPR